MAERASLTRAEPRTVEEARVAVEQSRARMSDTLDAIEGKIVAKRQEITDRMDIMRPVKQRVRKRPWPALALAFGIGVVIWKLRANHKDDDDEEEQASRLKRLLRRG